MPLGFASPAGWPAACPAWPGCPGGGSGGCAGMSPAVNAKPIATTINETSFGNRLCIAKHLVAGGIVSQCQVFGETKLALKTFGRARPREASALALHTQNPQQRQSHLKTDRSGSRVTRKVRGFACVLRSPNIKRRARENL